MPRQGTSARIICGNVGISAGGSKLRVLAERVGSGAPRVVSFSRAYPLTRQSGPQGMPAGVKFGPTARKGRSAGHQHISPHWARA
jgi:hypothetical protein